MPQEGNDNNLYAAKLECPRGFGQVEFKSDSTCPITGKRTCVECEKEQLNFEPPKQEK